MSSYASAMHEHYVKAALWSSTDGDDDRGLDQRGYTPRHIATDTAQEMRKDCERFFVQAKSPLMRAEVSPARAGHNFWLSRNGHGTGFWDDGLGEIGDQLHEIAKKFGECSLYIGDDRKVHACSG